jgi:hypothetical protein
MFTLASKETCLTYVELVSLLGEVDTSPTATALPTADMKTRLR